MKLNKNTKIFINYFLGPLLFIWLSWSIYRQIQKQTGLEEAWHRIRESLSGPMLWIIIVVLLLMIVNWSLEAIKWKISVKPVQDINFFRALQAIFSGISFSVSTPNRVGEYLGRLLYMKEGNRLKTISITIVGSISQLIITLLAGCIGLLLMRDQIEGAKLIDGLWMRVILSGVIVVLVVTVLIYFRLSWIVRWIESFPGAKRFRYLVEAIEEFKTGLLLRLLGLSLLRFMVFGLQYYLLFLLFDVNLGWWDAFWAINVSFLVMAIIPTIAIAELAQRGKVVTAILGLYSTNLLGMTFATAGIWFINLILPAVIGSLLILRTRKIVSKES